MNPIKRFFGAVFGSPATAGPPPSKESGADYFEDNPGPTKAPGADNPLVQPKLEPSDYNYDPPPPDKHAPPERDPLDAAQDSGTRRDFKPVEGVPDDVYRTPARWIPEQPGYTPSPGATFGRGARGMKP